MLNTMKTNRKAAKVGFGLTASMAIAAGVIAAPTANALPIGGPEVGNTYGKWGYGWDSSYTVPLASGGEQEGFCLDPFLAAPKQYAGVRYTEPKPYNITNPTDKRRLSVALYIGKIALAGDQQWNQLKQGIATIRNLESQLNSLPIPAQMKNSIKAAIPPSLKNLPDMSKWTKHDVAAAVSVVAHEIGSRGPEGNGRWNPGSRYLTNPRAKEVYSNINLLSDEIGKLTTVPVIGPEIKKITNLDLKQRYPSNWKGPNNGAQRMIVVGDIKLPELNIPIPGFDFNFDIPELPTLPDISTNPSTPTTESTTPNDVPDDRTTTTTTTTTPEVVKSSTPSTKRTTPRERPEREPDIEIRTSAGTKEDNIVEVGKTITDTVSYTGLEKGETYKLVGELIDPETGEKTGDKGEVEFTANSSDGEQDIDITVNNAANDELVVFESLYDDKGVLVAEHADVNDKAQTVGKPEYNPEIRTMAESSTGNVIQTGTTINDTVSYTGLEPGKTYRLEARLVCKADGVDTGASQSITFTPETTDGEVVVQGIQVTNPDCTEQVVFERLYDDETGELVAVHEDITDAAQTVGGPREEIQKKKKKVAPVDEPVEDAPEPEKEVIVPNIHQEQNQQQTAPGAPAPAGGMGGGGSSPAPRQVISAVPSGGAESFGSSAFNR